MALISLSGSYFLGYNQGHRDAKRADTEFGLVHHLALYKYAQEGNTNRLNDSLRFMIFGYCDYYDRHFSNETASDPFQKYLKDTRVIADQERTQVVSVDSAMDRINEELRTNHVAKAK